MFRKSFGVNQHYVKEHPGQFARLGFGSFTLHSGLQDTGSRRSDYHGSAWLMPSIHGTASYQSISGYNWPSNVMACRSAGILLSKHG